LLRDQKRSSAMAMYFLHVKVISRGKGGRVTRAAAYRAGERIRDERTSEVYNYTAREDVLHNEIVLASELAGRTDTSWARERAALWNAAEHRARRNARLAREVLVTLPPELGQAQRTELARTFARQLADRYRCAIDLAVHAPRAGSDPRHHHAHLLMTAREVTREGLGRRTTLELSGSERHARGLPPSKAELLWIRERWAEVTNERLREAGLMERVDHRGYRALGIDREPVPMMPQRVHYAERKSGAPHPVGEDIRARYQERIEARLKGPAALARVLERQRKEGRQRALANAARKEGLPKKTPHSALTREELNRIRRESYPTRAAEINRRRREHRRAHAAEINLKKREWCKTHAAEVNRQQREAYRRRRAALEAVKAGRPIAQEQTARRGAAAKRSLTHERSAGNRPQTSGPAARKIEKPESRTAEESVRRWQRLRELGQPSPTPEESVRQWRSLEKAERAPTEEESRQRWLKLRERANAAGAAGAAAGSSRGQGGKAGGAGDDEDSKGRKPGRSGPGHER
jgi:hypothetical protein